MESRYYAAIDLKSFYASVECMERGLDPMTTNLVVADASRTEKTICLAVTPALRPTAFPEGRGCSRSSKRSRKSMHSGSAGHGGENSLENLTMQTN